MCYPCLVDLELTKLKGATKDASGQAEGLEIESQVVILRSTGKTIHFVRDDL